MANAGCFKKGEKKPNQGKRGPNKTTLEVRQAIAQLAESSAPMVEQWLATVATEDPAKAMDLWLKMIEYHVPKLARTEVTGKDGGPVRVFATNLDEAL